jgi:hypothetical protein
MYQIVKIPSKIYPTTGTQNIQLRVQRGIYHKKSLITFKFTAMLAQEYTDIVSRKDCMYTCKNINVTLDGKQIFISQMPAILQSQYYASYNKNKPQKAYEFLNNNIIGQIQKDNFKYQDL